MAKTIPDSHYNRLTFFINLSGLINANGTALGWDVGKVASATGTLAPLIAAYQALVDAEHTLAATAAGAEQTYEQQSPALQSLLDELRGNPKCTAAMATEMQITPGGTDIDPDAIKPKLKAEAQAGHVRITGSKNYAELINIYMRRAGETTWTQVGIRRKKFPFDDQTPLKQPSMPEVREYMGRGVMDDEEVGQPSDIVEVTFAG